MSKLYILFLLIPIFSFGQKLTGQAKIDSLLVEMPKSKKDTTRVNILNIVAVLYVYENEQLSFKYATLANDLAKKINWNDGLTNSYMTLAGLQMLKRDYKKAKELYSKGLKTADRPNLKAKIYMGFGANYFYESNFPKAIEYNFEALKQFELSNDKLNTLKTLRNIGQLYIQIEQFENAIKVFEKCLILNKDVKLELECNVFHEIGTCYLNLKKYQIAKTKFGQAIALCPENKELVGVCYSSFGDIDQKENNFESALIYYNKALPLHKEIDDIVNYSNTLSNFSRCNLELSKIENNPTKKSNYLQVAISSAKESLLVGKDISDLITISDLNNTLSQAFKIQGNFKESLESHEQYVLYKDSIFNSDNKETIKNLEDKREIELRDNKLKINQLELNNKEKQKWYLLGGLGLLTIIGGLLFYQSRKRKQVNVKLETLNQELDQANKAKTRFFGILNHDLRGPVANLVFFLQLQQESPEMLDEESIKRMQDKTMTGAENLLSTMEDILQWSKSQMENFKPQPKNIAVSQLFNDTKKVFSGYLKINFEYQNPDNIEIFTDENYLKTIIRNLTSNAINVFTTTENPLIIWKAWQDAGSSYFSIQDNGPGANQEQFNALFEDTEITSAKSGLGLYLIRDMAKAINCEITVDSKIGVGTTFTLKI